MGWSATAKIWLVVAVLAVGIVVALVLAPWADQPAALAKVARAQDRFRRSGLDSYQVFVERACFGCDDPGFWITVEDGELTRVDTMKVDQLPSWQRWVERWGPIDRAFDSMKSSVSNGADGPAAMFVMPGDHHVKARFTSDPETGAPRSFSTSITNAADSWVSYHWSTFTPTRASTRRS